MEKDPYRSTVKKGAFAEDAILNFLSSKNIEMVLFKTFMSLCFT